MTLLIKTLVDQFIFAPFVAQFIIVLSFLWREHNYNPLALFRWLSLSKYLDRAIPVWFVGFSFWVPMLFVIYSMPSTLQFTLFLIANTAFNLVMIFVATNRAEQLAEAQT